MPEPRFVSGAQAINLERRLYWGEQLGQGIITNIYDALGEDTDDAAEARVAVVKIHDACWLSIDLSCVENRAEH